MTDPTANAASAPGTAPSPPASSAPVPAELSAQGLHELALEAFRIGNRGRLTLCESLRVLHETRLFYDLGFPSLAAYADTFFHLRRAETFECVRVAKALVELTELREAFGRGEIGWSVLKGPFDGFPRTSRHRALPPYPLLVVILAKYQRAPRSRRRAAEIDVLNPQVEDR